MTVCIAAACVESLADINNPQKKIVMCADRKSSSVLGSAETATKLVSLGNNWHCLTAGTESDIQALVKLYRERFKDPNNLTASTIDASIKAPLLERRMQLVEEYINRRFAMPFEEFKKEGKGRLSSEHFFDATQRISQLRLNTEFILAGFIGQEPEIYYTSDDGVAKAAAHFAVVGEGGYIAQSALLRRQQNDWSTLNGTLYNVFEAKRLAQAVGSVGPQTSLWTATSTHRPQLSSHAFDLQLETWYKKYGPQEIPADGLAFEGELFFEAKKSK